MGKWKDQIWADAIQDYEDKDSFYADESEFFYKMIADQTLKLKGRNRTNRKPSKMKISVIVSAKMNGSENRKLLS